ncbi:hypothetical protein GPJ56_007923 [Histomonas meleagridis]|uniref:uncharacterized protein n=1 Tax=Histomonas meleagridis TaxID=135588 RepID=UPI00355A19B3|nr:hypothetical protein GPJ56_007923 [Histomonas meleagridis]KAH0803865.1 hypothetical protein GO595_002695 [Histomonas meleagridis]
MSKTDANEEDYQSSPRYYPKQQEMQYLIPGLRRYFSFPERSQQRSQVVKEVKSYLEQISPHWSHRSVRLWFNNNKNNYLNIPLQIPNQDKAKYIIVQNQDPLINQTPNIGYIPAQQNALPIRIFQNQIPQAIPQTTPKPENPQMRKIIDAGPSPQYIRPQQFSLLSQENEPQKIQQSYPPISFSKDKKRPIKSLEQCLVPIKNLMDEIRKISPQDPKYNPSMLDLDQQCQYVQKNYSPFLPDKIDPTEKYVSLSLSPHGLQSLYNFGNGPSNSNLHEEGSEFQLQKFPSQFSLFSLPDLSSVGQNEQPLQKSSSSIWKALSFTDQQIQPFIDSVITADLAVYVTYSGNQTLILYSDYKAEYPRWENIVLTNPSKVAHIQVTPNNLWILSTSSNLECVTHISFSNSSKQTTISLASSKGDSNLSIFGNGVISSFVNDPTLYCIDESLQQSKIQTSYPGITSLIEMDNKIICGVTQSCSPRMITTFGQEECSFIGHCGEVIKLITISSNTFASLGLDQSIRIWDIRDKNPITTILTPDFSVLSISGNSEYIFCGRQDQKIGVVDIRKPPGKVVLGIATDDYEPTVHRYDDQTNRFYMFGRPSQERSMLTPDVQAASRVFRVYQNILE